MQTTREIDSLGVLLQSQSCLVIERAAASESQIAGALLKWGVPADKIFSASDCSEAMAHLKAHRPTVCILDFDTEIDEVRNLLSTFESLHPEAKRIALLLNSVGSSRFYSDGQVDGHLEKPLDVQLLRKILLKTMTQKFYPDTYMRKVLNGDQLTSSGQLEAANAEYQSACEINPNAYRAYRGLALLELKSGNRAGALNYFKKARDCSTLDYKGLASEFSVQLSLQDYSAAAKLIPLLGASSPPNASAFLRFCEVTLRAKSFAEVDTLVEMYSKLPNRSREFESATQGYLFKAAGEAFESAQPSKAVDIIEKAVGIDPQNFDFRATAVRELLKRNLGPAALALSTHLLPEGFDSVALRDLASEIGLHRAA